MKKIIKWEELTNPLFKKSYNEPVEEFRANYDETYLVPGKKSTDFILTETGQALFPKKENMWICHTNFPITKVDFDTVDNIDGVEYLKMMTPYKFQINIGRLFRGNSVRTEIKRKLCSNKKPGGSKSYANMINTYKQCLSKYPFWILYVDDSNNIRFAFGYSELDIHIDDLPKENIIDSSLHETTTSEQPGV